MGRETRRVIVIGPMPPPYHGAAKNTALLADRFAQHTTVQRLRTSPTSKVVYEQALKYHLSRSLLCLVNCAKLWWTLLTNSCTSVYLVPDGGLGGIYNLVYSVPLRLLAGRLAAHHRNYSYLDRPTGMHRLLFRMLGPRCRHIVLSPGMGRSLTKAYPFIGDDALVVCSNSVLSDVPDYGDERRSASSDEPLYIGHLSNLCPDKGTDLVLDLYDRLRSASGSEFAARYRFVLAGPVFDETLSERIRGLQAEGIGFDYLGPVYDAAKTNFFRSLHVFLFPSRYRNEAEPNVLYEALAAGALPIATEVGTIADMLAEGRGHVLPHGAEFVAQAATLLQNYRSAPQLLNEARGEAIESFARKRRQDRAGLARLEQIVAGADTELPATSAGDAVAVAAVRSVAKINGE